MQKIAFIHLYNDFSGSPTVLANVINGFTNNNFKVSLIANKSIGRLSNLKNVNYNLFNYKFEESKFLRLIAFLEAQVKIFFKVLFLSSDTKVYINTVLPFAAALAAFIKGSEVVYHIHETSVKPKILKRFLFSICNLTSKKTIYVSEFVALQESMHKTIPKVVYNAISKKQKMQLNLVKPSFNQLPNILMLCSLKDYKGIPEFISLAKELTNYSFTLVCNADEKEVKQYLRNKFMPLNLSVFSKVKNVVMFYNFASVVVNLSHTDRWIETFGLTLLEAMEAGIPVLGQPIGGNAEILEDGKYGYCIDSKDVNAVADQLVYLLENEEEYIKMSALSKKRAAFFNVEKQQSQIVDFVNQDSKIVNISKQPKAKVA